MYRLIVMLGIMFLVSCSQREIRAGDQHQEPPDPLKPGSRTTTDAGLDVAIRSDMDRQTCFLTTRFTGAINETFQYPSIPGSDCTVSRTDGLVVVSGSNPQLFDRFTVAVQLADRGSTDVFMGDSGPTYEIDEGNGQVTTWSGVMSDCDINIDANDSLGGDRYRLIGDGDCFGRIQPSTGSVSTRTLRFEGFSFDVEFDWP